MFRRILIALACLAGPGLQQAAAQEVLVSPGTVVFEDGQRSATLVVGNTGDETNIYRLEPVFFSMEESGRLVEMPAPPQISAEDFIRFAPRQFELPPGGSQTVRMAARRPADLAPGEYRIHLRVTNLGPAIDAPRAGKDAGAMGANIEIRVARAVRILVRHGVTAGTAQIAGLRATPDAGGLTKVEIDLARSGDGSSRGAYRLYTRDPQTGAVIADIAARGAHIYSDIPRRRIEQIVPAGVADGNVQICASYEDRNPAAGGAEEICTTRN